MHPASDAELQSWLALALTPELSPRTTTRLLEAFGSPQAIFAASESELAAWKLAPATLKAIANRSSLARAEKELRRVQQAGVALLCWADPRYPPLLRQIYDPPPVLYVRGDPAVLARHQIAIVGTRRPTPYGVQMAERLGRELAERGLVITSGLARGIDTLAHRGALAAPQGATVAVLGCGIDIVYPKENQKLYDQIAGGRGALVSRSEEHTSELQ